LDTFFAGARSVAAPHQWFNLQPDSILENILEGANSELWITFKVLALRSFSEAVGRGAEPQDRLVSIMNHKALIFLR